MRIRVFNLGCKVNNYEGEEIVRQLLERGHDAAVGIGFADAYILNTCAVTNEAERKSRQAVTRLLRINPEAKVYVCGCAAQYASARFEEIEGVKVVKGVANKAGLIDYIEKDIENTVVDIEPLPSVYPVSEGAFAEKTRASIKVCDGCNRFCSYCIVPYLRGRLRSRPIEDILKEFEKNKDRKEIVITGVDISSYGADIGENLLSLIRVLKAEGVRKRIGSLEASAVTEELLEEMKADGNWCDHFHLSLQSGSNDILKKMNRHYTASEFLDKIILIRKYFPDASLTTDVIVGFPGESDADHRETLNFVKAAGFSDIHPFIYSKRSGTLAARMSQIPPEVKKLREKELIRVKNELKAAFFGKHAGKEAEILIESKYGYTSNYIKVYPEGTLKPGETAKVVIGGVFKDGVRGRIIY